MTAFHDVSRIDKFIQVEEGQCFPGDWEKRGRGTNQLIGMGFLFEAMKML